MDLISNHLLKKKNTERESRPRLWDPAPFHHPFLLHNEWNYLWTKPGKIAPDQIWPIDKSRTVLLTLLCVTCWARNDWLSKNHVDINCARCHWYFFLYFLGRNEGRALILLIKPVARVLYQKRCHWYWSLQLRSKWISTLKISVSLKPDYI